jgi:hypothetical protein
MNNLSTYVLALAVCAATTLTALTNHHVGQNSRSANKSLALDGAYRDGLYLGRLTAESGQPLRPTVGRWSSEKDRTSFETGYRRGYNDVLASAVTATRNTNE